MFSIHSNESISNASEEHEIQNGNARNASFCRSLGRSNPFTWTMPCSTIRNDTQHDNAMCNLTLIDCAIIL
jgi:hypothetical protein